ncbi:FMN-binding negative transcriptional regulator [Halomonas urumqiensis]|uniref:Transcriptional regulator n=1 Tax=Halomonas urumqiensis TaxID=1684789 RepID=A0A2N7UD58_9GAMM|nr:FMN-binding negative transcriptional regulator [Halomonas urumqiensis]PMR78396.1 transcriptional regulator [Halomonas urumqiensis]PTB03542.1 FMN-binding negative transcriptional regulator [Halomonas urumqiensis]GHE20258.1 transcriptional regulator [Halomonas urumqiensis]
MHWPVQFRMQEHAACHRLIGTAPFATLISTIPGAQLNADHLPLLLMPASDDQGQDRLVGHIARANPLTKHLGSAVDHVEALAIFHGPHAYITPSWYPAKREHGKVVPTWNYQVVHAHGRLRLIDDTDWLRDVVTALTERFEGDRQSPWRVSDAPDEYLAAMCRAIVGVEITIERLEGKHKASQHKPLAERQAIQRGLRVEYGYGDQDAACLSGMTPSES